MKISATMATVATGVACLGACAAALGMGGAFVGLTVGGVLALLTGEVVQVLLFAALVTGGWYMWRRSRQPACACAPDQGCHATGACDAPEGGVKRPQE